MAENHAFSINGASYLIGSQDVKGLVVGRADTTAMGYGESEK